MEILDEIRSNLAANQNLTDEVKAKMFELCVLFHQKFPDVNLGKLKEKIKDVTAHAEILCIRESAKKLKRWNLSDCDLYVTLKPCNMCMEIIKQSRIKTVYYLLDKLDYKHEFSKTNIEQIKCEEDIDTYQQLLSDFFQNMR